MLIYLDCCSIQRPFDDQAQPRIRVESEAVLAIFDAIQAGDVSLMSSDALEFEINGIPDGIRRERSLELLAMAASTVEITDQVIDFAERLENHGIKGIDAMHLACASLYRADHFVTCDDRALRAALNIDFLDCRVTSILQFVSEILQ